MYLQGGASFNGNVNLSPSDTATSSSGAVAGSPIRISTYGTGVYGTSASPDGFGVVGVAATAGSAGTGVYGQVNTGYGINLGTSTGTVTNTKIGDPSAGAGAPVDP